jgi:hypothetical protein
MGRVTVVDEQDDEPLGWLMASRSNAWTDLALTLPLFVAYHLGVVLLTVRNAADAVTAHLIDLADNHVLVYWGITLAIGIALVGALVLLGRGEAFDKKRFVVVALEGVAYAMLMRTAAVYAVGALSLGGSGLGPWAGVVMSLGAGFYEEVVFRVGLFGIGVLLIRLVFGGLFKLILVLGWACASAAVFSGWHYVGAYGDAWDARTFVFRLACGLVLTAIYHLRGFAPAVWTHVLYDVWVMTLR